MYRIFIFIFFFTYTTLIRAQKIDVIIEDDLVHFVENKDSILTYQRADKSYNGSYKRSNYIHPLYTIDGEKLTEDFPEDHPHHRGVFWAWHQLYIGDKRLGDAWDIKDFHWDIKSVKELKVEGNAKAIQTEVFWKTPNWKDEDENEKSVVKETSTIKVYPVENNYRKIDIEISILALEPNMSIGGAENKTGYGGFSARIRLVNDINFISSTGTLIPNILPLKAGNWLDISGSFSKGKLLSGLSILCHPNNPGVSNHWVLRNKRSMQNAVYPYPGANTVPLSNTESTVLRYRLLVHKGDKEVIDIASEYTEYGNQ